MPKLLRFLLFAALVAIFGHDGKSQPAPNTVTIFGSGAPSGTCQGVFMRYVDTSANDEWGCASAGGSWFKIGGGSTGGTVTSVASGTGLSGGPITTSGTLSCVNGSASAKGCVQVDGTTITASSGVISAGSIGFSGIGSGTNANTLTVGTGGTLTFSGSGVINADQLNGTSFAGTNGDLVSFGASNIPADSNVVASDAITYHTPATGIARTTTSSQALTSSELSGACSTSGSNVVTCTPKGGGIPGGVASATSSSGGINTTETTLVSYTIPANTIAAGTVYRIMFSGVCTTTAANLSHWKIYYGTNGDNTDTNLIDFTETSGTTGTSIAFQGIFTITWRSTSIASTAGAVVSTGATGIGPAVWTGSPAPVSSIDTTTSKILHLSYFSAATTTTSTIGQAIIEVVKP